MKVEKAQFDRLLQRMLRSPVEPVKSIRSEARLGKIIPDPAAQLGEADRRPVLPPRTVR